MTRSNVNLFRQNKQLHQVKKLTWLSNITLSEQSISKSAAKYMVLDMAYCIRARIEGVELDLLDWLRAGFGFQVC
jgi:hypothetical protein